MDKATETIIMIEPRRPNGKRRFVLAAAPSRWRRAHSRKASIRPGRSNWSCPRPPAATPKEIVELWEKELLSLAKDPAFARCMREMSFDPVAFGTAEFARMMAAERVQWAAAVKAAGIDTKKQ